MNAAQQLDYVADAFTTIYLISTEEEIQRDIAAFTLRWGGVDLLTFAYVLQHTQGTDQIIAASALGHTLYWP